MSTPIRKDVVLQITAQIFLARNPNLGFEGLPSTNRVYGTEKLTYREQELQICAGFAWEMAQAVVRMEPEGHHI